MPVNLALQLQDRYPYAFPERGNGFIKYECGDGWYSIIESLSYLLNDFNQRVGQQPTQLLRVTEKFGIMRILVSGRTSESHAWISFAERHSTRVCEICGSCGQLLYEDGWQRVRCELHRDSNRTP